MQNLRPPPPPRQGLRRDRRVTLIIPLDLAAAVNADLAAGWTPTSIIVTALRRAYKIKAAPKKAKRGV